MKFELYLSKPQNLKTLEHFNPSNPNNPKILGEKKRLSPNSKHRHSTRHLLLVTRHLETDKINIDTDLKLFKIGF